MCVYEIMRVIKEKTEKSKKDERVNKKVKKEGSRKMQLERNGSSLLKYLNDSSCILYKCLADFYLYQIPL